MDSLVSKVKKFVKDYGKKEGYSYIFGTGEAVSILYAQDKYDITKEIVKALNEQYASDGKGNRQRRRRRPSQSRAQGHRKEKEIKSNPQY
jgi:outer membrane protein